MLTRELVEAVVERSLREDAPIGDVTTEMLIARDVATTASVVARSDGVMAAEMLLPVAFAGCHVDVLIEDGQTFAAGSVLATIDGSARAVLLAERTALNLAQRMCGIATLTRRYVEAVQGTGSRIVDTRKTTPGLRAIERHAVVCGGGFNHRNSLSDAVLIKDNHLAIALAQGADLTEMLRRLKSRLPHTFHVEVEVDRLEQIEEVLASGVVDTIMLDNFTTEQLRKGVDLVARRALVEASGGVDLDTVEAIARTGVDLISVGALTHAAHAIDLGLDIGPYDPEAIRR